MNYLNMATLSEALRLEYLDAELVELFENAYQITKRFSTKNGIEWDVSLDDFREELIKAWKKKVSQSDEILMLRYQKGVKYNKENPYDIDARILLVSIIHELRYRNISEAEALKFEPKSGFETIFGDTVEEVLDMM